MLRSKTYFQGLIFFLLITPSLLLGYEKETAPATLEITVEDDQGALVHQAHVYIFSQDKKQFFGTRDVYGITTFELPAGAYRVYAAQTTRARGLIDHYSSPEAFVHLSTQEATSVILSLRKAAESDLYLTDTARQKLGIEEELAKYLN